jgi:hypothetical protein
MIAIPAIVPASAGIGSVSIATCLACGCIWRTQGSNRIQRLATAWAPPPQEFHASVQP